MGNFSTRLEMLSSVTTAAPWLGDEVVDAVVDLRVHMVRTARQHDDPLALDGGLRQ